MKSEHVGKTISEAEVTHISSHGIWILSDNEELFLSYDDFPWFKDIAVGKILNLKIAIHFLEAKKWKF